MGEDDDRGAYLLLLVQLLLDAVPGVARRARVAARARLATLGRANHPPEGRLLSAGYGQQGQEQAYCRSAEVVVCVCVGGGGGLG